MSRSGYTDDNEDQWDFIRYRGAVKSALNGARGQAFLKEMLAALDAMPVKALIKNELEDAFPLSVSHWGFVEAPAVCAIGAVGRARGIDMTNIDSNDPEAVAGKFGIADAMAREIVYENDEGRWRETPEQRFERMRAWIVAHIIEDPRA